MRGVAVSRVFFECGADGVEGAQAVVPGGVELAADAALAGEGALGVPGAGDGLLPLRAQACSQVSRSSGVRMT